MVEMIFNKKTYELSLTRNYVSSWGVAQAVRELIQNALDSGSPFIYEFEQEDDGRMTMMLRSEFSTLLPQTLLLGASSKSDDPNAIGSFGEGYKIAMLVLTRLDKDVVIHNGKMQWMPRFKMNHQFGEELLAIDEEPLSHKHGGLTYYVHNLDDSEVETIVDSCLRMQNNVGHIKQTRYGDILIDRPGKLYVGSLFICDTDLEFGYNIKPEFITLERDRQTVSNWDLKNVTRDMWTETCEFERIAEMIAEECPDLEYFRYTDNAAVKDACYQHFITHHPGKVIANNDKELKELVAQGMTVYVGGDTYYSQVSKSRSYMNQFKITRVKAAPPRDILAKFLRDNKQYMQRHAIVAFKDLIEKSQEWKAE
jgi:hypothetical protein